MAVPQGQVLPVWREPGHHARLGALQQGQAYLGLLSQELQRTRSVLVAQLAAGRAAEGSPSPALQEQAQRLDRVWQARAQLAGGRVDGQLQAAAPEAQALKRFTLRGLDLNSLQSQGPETLRLALPGQAQMQTLRLQGDAHTDPQGDVARLARTLAPSGVAVQAGADGRLLLSVTESRWPETQDGWLLSGEGKRFPSGQMLRPWLQPEPEALNPGQWQLNTRDGQRAALAQIVQAQTAVPSAQQAIAAQLQSAASTAPLAAPPSSTAAPTERSAASADAELPTAQRMRLQAQQLRNRMCGTDAPEPSGLAVGRLMDLLPAVQHLRRDGVRQLLQD